MRVLVARPRDGGDRTAARLVALGHSALVAPVLEIRPSGEPPPAIRPDAIAVTSAHAVPALGLWRERFAGVPVFAVGDATARALREAGIADVTVAGADGAALAASIAAALARNGTILHAAGRDRRPEPRRSLLAAGFSAETWECYAAEAVPALPAHLATALADGSLHAALHYSRRSAETLCRLADAAGLNAALRGLRHVCLSTEVSAGLEPLDPADLSVAAQPTEDALFEALGR